MSPDKKDQRDQKGETRDSDEECVVVLERPEGGTCVGNVHQMEKIRYDHKRPVRIN
jgi:hypothetical protein